MAANWPEWKLLPPDGLPPAVREVCEREYVDLRPDGATLDGSFTADELRAIAAHLDATKVVPTGGST